MKPLISVIVPVYNVEKYLNKCIDSILQQTYQNLEIILVDDGSPDNCPRICDEYKEKDSRIKVIHKPNGGLSDARNVGMTYATGDLITFVDSDDYISPNMYTSMHSAMERTNADIAICGVEDQFIDVTIGQATSVDYIHEQTVLTGYKAMKYVLEDRVIVSHVWDKLYKCDLLKDIKFPVGRRFEDMYVMHQILQRADQVVMIPEKMYFYIHRSESISYTQQDKNCYDIIHAYIERKRFTEKCCPELQSVVVKQIGVSTVNLYNTVLINRNKEINVGDLFQILKIYRAEILHLHDIPFKFRFFCFFLTAWPRTYACFYRILTSIRLKIRSMRTLHE